MWNTIVGNITKPLSRWEWKYDIIENIIPVRLPYLVKNLLNPGSEKLCELMGVWCAFIHEGKFSSKIEEEMYGVHF